MNRNQTKAMIVLLFGWVMWLIAIALSNDPTVALGCAGGSLMIAAIIYLSRNKLP